jgi:signal transduction histidine kinase
MLFLQHPADGSAENPAARMPVGDAAGLYLERALLAPDAATRLADVGQALAAERSLANWALATAEMRSGRTVNRIDEAAEWLSENLVTELAGSICGDNTEPSRTGIDWRLPALVKKLFACEQQQADFERRLELEKLNALKELAYGASHEINNPLANIAARAQTLLDDEQDPQRRQKLIAIHRQAMRAHEMISDLMLFARPPKLNLTSFSLRELIRKVVGGLSTLAKESSVQLNCSENELSGEIRADETQLGVALHALIKNSIEAVDEGGRVSVVVRSILVAGEPWVEIVIGDDGPGISADVRRHIFDPFFSGREAGRGLGFGLSKCWRIVTDHGGQIVVRSPAGGCAEISILLPIALTQQNSSDSLDKAPAAGI